MGTTNLLGICGSLRTNSRNRGLLRCAQQVMPAGASLEIFDISSFPFYSEELKKPECIETFIDRIKTASGLVMAVPEYNYSIAPALKNALDWMSREPREIFSGKPAAIMGAGGGMGTARAQYHLRQVCVYLDLRVLNKPEIFSNAFSPAFDVRGDVADTSEGSALRNSIAELMENLVQRC